MCSSDLVDLKAAIQYGKLDEASSKIDDILDSNKIYKNEISRTGNLVIDSLINYKFSLAQKEGIDMKCYVFVPDRLPFDGTDLCIILGNLLDNAMEAVGCFPTGHRYMSVSVISCAVCADEGDYFTLLNVEGNALYCVYRAVIYL